MSEFHKTAAGRKFYETDMPRLINALEKIASKLDEYSKIENKKLKLAEKETIKRFKSLSESKSFDRIKPKL